MRYIIMLMLIMVGAFSDDGTILIEVSYKGEEYNITRAWKVEKEFPSTVGTFSDSEEDIIIKLKDSNGTVIEKLRVENPRMVRGILSEESTEGGHENFLNKEGSFILRYPYHEGLKYLNIINVKEKKSKLNKQCKVMGVKENIDLEFASFLK